MGLRSAEALPLAGTVAFSEPARHLHARDDSRRLGSFDRQRPDGHARISFRESGTSRSGPHRPIRDSRRRTAARRFSRRTLAPIESWTAESQSWPNATERAIMSAPQDSPKPAGSSGYWSGTRKPLACLIFVIPLLAAYEAGVVWLGGPDSDAFRSGTDAWLRGGLETSGSIAPGSCRRRSSSGCWSGTSPNRSRGGSIRGNVGRNAGRELALRLRARCAGAVAELRAARLANGRCDDDRNSGERTAALAIIFLGAGIYEEVLFRLVPDADVPRRFRTTGVRPGLAAFMAAVATSLAFSLAHYVGASRRRAVWLF